MALSNAFSSSAGSGERGFVARIHEVRQRTTHSTVLRKRAENELIGRFCKAELVDFSGGVVELFQVQIECVDVLALVFVRANGI